MNKSRKNLVIAVVGDESCHKKWLSGAERNFDLMLIYIGGKKDKYKDDAQFYYQKKGLFKLENISFAISRSLEEVKKYNAIFLPDDDITMSAKDVNRLFDIFYKYDLDLAQPAVKSGKINHLMTKRNLFCFLRYVNFIEMMGPIFRTDILLEVLPIFNLTRSGWGIDFLWSKKLENKKMAIIDAVAVRHGSNEKPIREGEYYKNLNKARINADTECQEICNKYNCKFNLRVYKKIYGLFNKFI